MHKFFSLIILVFLVLAGCQPAEEHLPQNDFKVHTYYVIPADKSYVEENARRVVRTIWQMQRWYQTATGGLTFEILDEENVAEVYFADRGTAFYEDNWWELILNEMKNNKLPVESPGTIVMIWVEGITNVSVTATAQGGTSCGGNCGAAVMPISTLLTPTTPPADMGLLLHELGHALGLRHPIDESELPLPPDKQPILYSVMNQTNIRAGKTSVEHGFLTNEKQTLINSPFMKQIPLDYQDFWQTKIINYPVTGPAPEPRIIVESTSFREVTFSTNIDDGLLYYWNFGDGTVSHEPAPSHTFPANGLYNVTVMVTTKDFMAGRVSKFVQL